MATAKELVVGSVWGFISGDLDEAWPRTIQNALGNPITITGPREKRWALLMGSSRRYDGEVNGPLATCKGASYRSPLAHAIRPGKTMKSADEERGRIIPNTYVITSGRGLYSAAALTEALARAIAREKAQEQARADRHAAGKASEKAVQDLRHLFPGITLLAESDGRIRVAFRDAETFRAFCGVLVAAEVTP